MANSTRTTVISAPPKEWQKHFFRGVALDFWNNAVNPLAKAEAAYLKRQLKLRRGQQVLDVPCGNGRHALELAAMGVNVTGVDFSTEQLKIAQTAAKKQRLKVEFIKRDKRQLNFNEQFHGAYCCGNSFGYLDEFGMEQFVAGVSSALKIGGRFVIDTAMAAESIIPNLDESWWMQAGDVTAMVHNYYHAAASTLFTTITFLKKGRSVTREIRHRCYTVAELTALLRRHQLTVIDLHADIHKVPYAFAEPQLWLTAEKGF